LGWNELSFLAATHPHRDHVEGMSIICDAFQGKCDGLWVFPGFSIGKVFDRFIRWIEASKPNEEIDEHFVSRMVMREWRGLAEFATHEKLIPKVMREWRGAVQIEEGIEITCLLPSSTTSDNFENALSNCAPSEEFLKSQGTVKQTLKLT